MTIPPLQKRFGYRGVALLRIAVLEVLFDAKSQDECLEYTEITKRAGIYRGSGPSMNHIIWGVINSLIADHYLDRCENEEGKPCWKLDNRKYEERKIAIADRQNWESDEQMVQAFLTKQWGFCPVCFATLPDNLAVDHIKPIEKYGKNNLEDMQLLCPDCNTRCDSNPVMEYLQERISGESEMANYVPDFDKVYTPKI